MRNYARYGGGSRAVHGGQSAAERAEQQLGPRPERPLLFRVVSECTLHDLPLPPPGSADESGGVRVRPLSLVDTKEMLEDLFEEGAEGGGEAEEGVLASFGLRATAEWLQRVREGLGRRFSIRG